MTEDQLTSMELESGQDSRVAHEVDDVTDDDGGARVRPTGLADPGDSVIGGLAFGQGNITRGAGPNGKERLAAIAAGEDDQVVLRPEA